MASLGAKFLGKLPGSYLTDVQKLARGIWPWADGVRGRLPEHYKERYMDRYRIPPRPVHYIPDKRKYKVDKHGTRIPVQNVPIPILYPRLAEEGLWGGEGIIQGYHKRKDKPMKPRTAVIWKPQLLKRAFYSEVLDRWMEIIVTRRTLDLVDEAYGFDNYILQTAEVDLRSKLGMRLKREMLLALANKSVRPGDQEANDKIYNKYKKFIIPMEEAEWVGLSIEDAEKKVLSLEDSETKAAIKPLKFQFAQDTLNELREKHPEDEGSSASGMLSRLNPFRSESQKTS